MADRKLYRTSITYWLAFPEAFANWKTPTSAEFTAGIASGLITNITCAVSEEGTQFDLADSDTDDSLSFCQSAGAVSPTFYNTDITLQIFRSADPTAVNTANKALALLNYPDVEYFAIERIGGNPDVAVAAGDRLNMARVITDNPVDVLDSGSNEQLSNTLLSQGDINWRYEVAA